MRVGGRRVAFVNALRPFHDFRAQLARKLARPRRIGMMLWARSSSDGSVFDNFRFFVAEKSRRGPVWCPVRIT